MREAHPLEKAVGIEWYLSEADGTGGELKTTTENFAVTELEDVSFAPRSASLDAYPHLIVRVTLDGWDTYDFASRLADTTGVHPEAIQWAGTKDKYARTTQLFSIHGLDEAELPTISRATIEPVGRFGRPLRFGDLRGNRFEIQVLEPAHPEQVGVIENELVAFGEGELSIPNYFGQQRFGSARPVTHEVGRQIVQGDWKGAVMAYLGSPTEREPEDTQQARAYVDRTEDWEGALDRFPRRLGHERTLLTSLADTDSTGVECYRDALGEFPSSLQRLFVHAFQSFLFNRILSARLASDLPLIRAEAGDKVCFTEADPVLGRRPAIDRTQSVSSDRVAVIARHMDRGRALLTLPLVGTDTELAGGAQGELERAVLDRYGVSPTDFDLPEPYNSSGTRRTALLSPPMQIERDPLTFRFALPSGAYATVVLREFLKVSPEQMR